MKFVTLLILVCLAPFAMAATATPEFDWAALLSGLFGETGKAIAGWIGFGLVVWSQLRQIIPAKYLAKLPDWVIDVLEFLAANKGQAANDMTNDPRYVKTSRL